MLFRLPFSRTGRGWCANLREYYPAALAAFGHDLHGRDAMAVLGAAPGPNAGARLTPAGVQALLRQAGRQRYVAARSGEIVEALQSPQLPARPGIEAAYTATTAALVAVIRELNTQIGVLQGQVEESFGRHPDAEVYLSQPGMGPVLGARVLGGFGDAADRYADARSRRNYAGTSPVTRASGTKRSVLARHARNRRLADALDLQAFTALSTSPGARAYYDARRSPPGPPRPGQPARRDPPRLAPPPRHLQRGHGVAHHNPKR